jgi:FkbM family methyltransferase
LQQQVKKGMQIIDIGAHIGLFSACSSQLTGPTGKIICFEPTPGTFSILEDTLRLNHCDNVTAVQAAVSEKEGIATFYVSSTAGCNSNSLIKNQWGGNPVGYEVRLVTIDGIVAENNFKPSLIKIDAEGAELDVLKGGIKTFRDYKPVLILGLHPDFIKEKGDSPEAIWDFLEAVPYIIKLDGKEMTRQDFCGRDLLFDVHCFAE